MRGNVHVIQLKQAAKEYDEYYLNFAKKKKNFFFPLTSRVYILLISCEVMSDSFTPWTITYQTPLSMGFSRQEYWRGLPFPSPGDLPNQGSNLCLPGLLQADSLPLSPWQARVSQSIYLIHPSIQIKDQKENSAV